MDVYSYSLILYQLLTRKQAWHGLSEEEYQEYELKKVYRPPVPDMALPGYRRIIESCWEEDPKKRPNFDQILNRLERVFRQNPEYDKINACRV